MYVCMYVCAGYWVNEEFSKERIRLDRDERVVRSLEVVLIVSGDLLLNILHGTSSQIFATPCYNCYHTDL